MNALTKLDAETVRFRIKSILLENPELDEDDQLRFDTLDGELDIKELIAEINRRIDANADLLGDISAVVSARKVRASEAMERKVRFQRREDALYDLALSIMQAANIKNVELPTATLYLSRTAPKPIDMGTEPIENLPDRFVTIKRHANLAAIREALLAGEVIPGYLLSNGQLTLNIKRK